MAADRPPWVTVWALHVTDDARYVRYREAMTPILRRFGGAFGYDLVVSEVKKTEAPHPVNRLFTIRFPDAAACDAFFADPEYRAARARHFEGAVGGVARVGAFREG